jgi:hypothetical protein
MEGFSRPGSLGGEAHDDDVVEGHMMDDQRTQDQDTEGHALWRSATDDDTEGHLGRGGAKNPRATDDDDTEGHIGLRRASGDEDDTEGHLAGLNRRASDEEDDTEGHGIQKR